ncbi:hypothetical protein [Cellulomonas hominis]
MPHLSAYLSKYNVGIGLVTAVLSIAVLAVPQTREFADDHGVAGWVAALLLLAAVFVKGDESDAEKSAERAGVATAREQAAAAARGKALAKDLQLVRGRLGDWKVDSDFFELLVHADHNFFPITAKRDIRARAETWSNDQRKIGTPELTDAWVRVSGAADRYSAALSHLDRMYDGTEDTRPGHLGLSHGIPYPERQHISDELEGSATALMAALQHIEAVLHDLD